MPARYKNLDPNHRPHRATAILRWGLWEPLVGKRKRTPPGTPAPRVEPDLALIQDAGERFRLTWLGHAAFLVSLAGRNFLVDPLLSRRVAGVYPNYSPSPLGAADWPRIDAVLVSHNHYDHLDLIALRSLPRDVPAVVPSGLSRWFARWNRRPVRELAWWQSTEIGGVAITIVPSRHWSRRGILDVNRSHWGGFVIESRGRSVYHAGDTAWFDGFAEIGSKFPGLAVCMLPVGSYEPGWFMENNHLTPEQACRAFVETGAHTFVPMHWGALRLTDESLSEPIERVEAWWRDHHPGNGRRLARLAVGETLSPE